MPDKGSAWDIRREGRKWSADEAEARSCQIIPDRPEIHQGKLYFTDEERLAVTACLLENLGIDRVVRSLGSRALWVEAVTSLSAEPNPESAFVRVRLDSFQVEELQKLAQEHGTTESEEIEKAVDAYLLGVSRQEISLIYALIDKLNRSTARAEKALDELSQATLANAEGTARKHHNRPLARGSRPTYPPDDGPLTKEQLKAIKKRVSQGDPKIFKSLFEKEPHVRTGSQRKSCTRAGRSRKKNR